jgi:hypothetical protein
MPVRFIARQSIDASVAEEAMAILDGDRQFGRADGVRSVGADDERFAFWRRR